MEYVAKISENEIARTVKLADLRHNSDLTRLDEIDDKACNRIEKYKAAIRLLSESKTSFCPYYDKGTDTWRVDFPDRDSEEGDLLYVASEYARTGLYYPYNVAVTAGKEYSGHAHSFEGVIQALLDDPAGFSIAGFEEFYSKQEQEMLVYEGENALDNTKKQNIFFGATCQHCEPKKISVRKTQKPQRFLGFLCHFSRWNSKDIISQKRPLGRT